MLYGIPPIPYTTPGSDDLTSGGGGGPPLSNLNPQPLGVPAPGVGGAASREDHVHQMPALGDLTNVSVAAPNNLDVLTYDNATSTWIAAPGGGGGGWPNVTGTDINGRVYEQALVATANTTIILTPTGTGAIQAQVADNAVTGGNARGDNAVDLQTATRTAATQVASGLNSVIAGGLRNTASDDWATVGGGVANTASDRYTAVAGGQGNTASSDHANVAGGINNTASGARVTVGGGESNTASGSYATIAGGYYGLAAQYGMFSHASGRFTVTGDAQYSRMVLRRETTDATPVVLSADGNAPGTSTIFLLANNSCLTFSIQVSARENATGDTAWWKFEGCIKRGANAAATALVGSVFQTTDADAGAAAWTFTVTADTTNGALELTATGEALKTIRWVATVHTTRVAG
jgi:hypothetical protein